jgi:hypothetical protein
MKEPDATWRRQYRERRYLEFESPANIETRLSDIARNAYILDRVGRYQVVAGPEVWQEMIAHILEEATLRNINLRNPTLPRYRKAVQAAELWDSIRTLDKGYLLKFGKDKYMTALYETGRFRIAAPDTYADPALNTEIGDNEREFTQESIGGSVQFPPNRDYSIPREQWISAPIIGTLKHTRSYEGYCYMASLGKLYEYRLFEDLGYDACVVIRDPMRFLAAAKAIGENALPGWQFYFDNVIYRDTFRPDKNDDVLYSKHFRFSYQSELRLTWERPVPVPLPLSPVFLDFGPLKDYCDLLILK